jgi:hypothetical protein
MDITYYVVVPFDRDADGALTPGEAAEAPNASAAARRARTLALSHAGALAFSRSGDPAAGEFRDAVVLAEFGEVEPAALGA